MKLKQSGNKLSVKQLEEAIKRAHPHIAIKRRSGSLTTVKKNKAIGTEVYAGKNNIHIKAAWASPGARILFWISLILLGIIIPLIIYLTCFRPKMKRLEKQIGKTIAEEIG
ncbi:MAG: hypothetical protein U9Q98_07580 [Bacteroidota bacterium]|nr:hypothetical protein [Bacteroidota bacterium]